MQFQVPQFIETEDKIIGPLTIKQFLYIAAGGALCFSLFFFLNTGVWIFFVILIMPIFLILAFAQVNGRPLPGVLISALGYYWKPRFYIWKREVPKTPELHIAQPKFGGAKSLLDNLMSQMQTSKNPIPQREKTIQPAITDRIKSSKERFETMRKITGEREMARRIDYR